MTTATKPLPLADQLTAARARVAALEAEAAASSGEYAEAARADDSGRLFALSTRRDQGPIELSVARIEAARLQVEPSRAAEATADSELEACSAERDTALGRGKSQRTEAVENLPRSVLEQASLPQLNFRIPGS